MNIWKMFLGHAPARRNHLDALDGLRGLAVLIVLASHLSNAGMLGAPGLAGAGKSGVYLFFVLSAYLLTRPLLQRTPRAFASPYVWTDYALRRVLRIWPLYLVVLGASWALARAGHPWHYHMDTPTLARHLALREGQSVLWSIPVEFTFYLWLPLIALGLASMRSRRWSAAAEISAAVAALLLAWWAWPPASTQVNDARLGPYLTVFLCGSLAAYLDASLQAESAAARRAWGAIGLAAVSACVLAVPAVWALVRRHPFDGAVNHTWFLFFGLAWSALLLALLRGPRWLRAPFSSAPMRLVGVVSFSVYLWHMPVLEGLRALGLPLGPAGTLVVVPTVLVAAMLSYLLFERPWRDIRFAPGAARAESS